MADEKATSGEHADWTTSLESDSGEVSGVQVEAAGAEAAAAVERNHVERMRRADKAEEERGVAAARAKAGETIAGIASGSVPSPRRASSPAAPVWRDKDECEAAAKDRARLEKIAKEMADIAATRKQERETTANPRDLHDLS
ncbi:uncharacterized protein LOC112347206 [Selaginella moellendorffii]|uniref:uncharacterized protein LOC112347206 n=1 Tax=Selaginella moellendorffii TaxID=88036 RepID=UPI000D1C6DCE|nr:uncharacterized protein LOC112347206 [Selaginella moellendorffii]|eukprot:XP_024533466.1 uncharacterized protein LOC112347206 [Selaginella moellendorffii]